MRTICAYARRRGFHTNGVRVYGGGERKVVIERDGKQTNELTHICRARFLFFYEVRIKSDGVSPSGRMFEMSGKRD